MIKKTLEEMWSFWNRIQQLHFKSYSCSSSVRTHSGLYYSVISPLYMYEQDIGCSVDLKEFYSQVPQIANVTEDAVR